MPADAPLLPQAQVQLPERPLSTSVRTGLSAWKAARPAAPKGSKRPRKRFPQFRRCAPLAQMEKPLPILLGGLAAARVETKSVSSRDCWGAAGQGPQSQLGGRHPVAPSGQCSVGLSVWARLTRWCPPALASAESEQVGNLAICPSVLSRKRSEIGRAHV